MCSDDKHRASYSLMAHYALLSDPTSCAKVVANKRLASGLLSVVAARGAKDSRWVSVCSWCVQHACLIVMVAVGCCWGDSCSPATLCANTAEMS